MNGLLFKVGNDVKSQAHTLFVELLSLIYCFLFTLSVSVDYISPKEPTVNYLWEGKLNQIIMIQNQSPHKYDESPGEDFGRSQKTCMHISKNHDN